MTNPFTLSSTDAFLDRTIIVHFEKTYSHGDYIKLQKSSLFKIGEWVGIMVMKTNAIVDKENIAKVAKHETVVIYGF